MISHSELLKFISYDPETGIFIRIFSTRNKHLEGTKAGTINKKGYEEINIGSKKYKSHRLAWFYVYKVWPVDKIDHKNGIRLDNRIDNLREATSSQNAMNRKKKCNNTSGHTGVFWDKRKKRWKSLITVDGKNTHLGSFIKIEDAIVARKAAEPNYFKQFLRN